MSRISQIALLSLLGLGALASPLQLRADVIIDSFDDNPSVGVFRRFGDNSTSGSAFVNPAPGIVFGDVGRTYDIDIENPALPNGDNVTGAAITASSGRLNMITDPGYGASWTVFYDHDPNGIDLSANTQFVISGRADANGAVNAAIELFDGTNTVSAPFVIPMNPVNVFDEIDIPFSSFAGIDFTNIESILLTINDSGTTVTESDVQLDFFSAVGNVPEPASIALWSIAGLGLAATAYRFGKRKK